MAGVFVASKGLTLQTSEDGLTWHDTHTMSGTGQIRSLAYGEEAIVGVGTSGSIVRSTDGETWTEISSGTSGSILSVAYGAGVFMAATSDTNELLVSYDKGLTWTIEPKTLAGAELSYAFGHFYLTGAVVIDGRGVYRSNDLGETWQFYAWWGNGSSPAPSSIRFHESENHLIGVSNASAGAGATTPRSVANANPDGSNFQTIEYGVSSSSKISIKASIVYNNVLHVFSTGQDYSGRYRTLDTDNLPAEITAPTMSGSGAGYSWSGVAAGDDIMVAVASDGGVSNPQRMARLDLSQSSPAWSFIGSQTSPIYAIVYANSPKGLVKVWGGSSHIEKPVKVWDGANWERKPAKYWDGTNWV